MTFVLIYLEGLSCIPIHGALLNVLAQDPLPFTSDRQSFSPFRKVCVRCMADGTNVSATMCTTDTPPWRYWPSTSLPPHPFQILTRLLHNWVRIPKQAVVLHGAMILVPLLWVNLNTEPGVELSLIHI